MWSHDYIYFSCYCCLGYYVFLLLFYCISPMPFYFYCSCLLCPYLFSEKGKDSRAQCPLRLKFGPFYSLFFIFFLFVLYHSLSASSLGLPLSPYLYLFYITLSSSPVLPFYSPSFLNSLYLLFILHIFFYVMPFVLPLFHLLLFPSLYLLSLSAPLPLSSASPSLLPPSFPHPPSKIQWPLLIILSDTSYFIPSYTFMRTSYLFIFLFFFLFFASSGECRYFETGNLVGHLPGMCFVQLELPACDTFPPTVCVWYDMFLLRGWPRVEAAADADISLLMCAGNQVFGTRFESVTSSDPWNLWCRNPLRVSWEWQSGLKSLCELYFFLPFCLEK